MHTLGLGRDLISRALEAASLTPGLRPNCVAPRAVTEQLLVHARRRAEHGLLL